MSCIKEQLALYLVTDSRLLNGRRLADVVRQAVSGGVTMVQLREKDASTRVIMERAREVQQALQGTGVPLIINDRIDIALAINADGVHIGQSDMPYAEARRLMGADKIIGLSAENMHQVLAANALDVDYIGISPVFGTMTKTDTATPFGIDGLREAVRLSCHPTVAIGGIHSHNAAAVRDTGTSGIAVVSEIMGSDYPQRAAENMLQMMK